jgi:hypothetical protein
MLHILIVLSAEADAKISGFVGDTAKSLTSLPLSVKLLQQCSVHSLRHVL